MVTGTVTAPALAVEAVVHLYSLAQTAGTVYIDDLFLAEMNAGDLIVDGRIRANHLDTTSAVITGTAQIGDAIITSAKILGTLAASKLDIATRNVSLTGLLFDFNAPAANRCSWTAGSARWINDAGAVTSVTIAAGSTAVWTTGVIYIYWVQGATTLSTTTVAATAFASGNLVVATYLGGNLVNASFGSRTVIDGPNIKAASVTAAQGIFAALAVKTIDLAVGAVSQLVIIASVSAFVDSSAVYNNTYTADGAYVALGVAGAGFQLAHTLTYTISSDPDFKPEKFQVQIRAILDQTTWTNTTATGTKYISLASVFVLIKKNGVYFSRTSFDFMYVKTDGISVYETKVTEDSRDGTFTSASYASGDVFTFEFYLYKFRTTGSAIAFMENVTKSSISIVEYLK